jgi:putative ABC transport system permease protein
VVLRTLLRWLTDAPLADSIVGDLEEGRRGRSAGLRAAGWFFATALSIVIVVAMRKIRERVRDLATTRVGRRRTPELRQALRALRSAPWYTVTAVGVIALSMVLATTVFAIVDGVLFKPLPYPNADDLYDVTGGFSALPDFTMGTVSRLDAERWAAVVPEGRFTAVSIGAAATIADNDYWRAAYVDRNFFDVIGVRPLIGGFNDGDFGVAQKVKPVIVTYETWQQPLGGTRDAIGRLLLDAKGEGVRIVGVMPPGFVYPHPAGRVAPAALAPLPAGSPASLQNPASRSVQLLARMPHDVNRAAVEGRLAFAAREVAQRFPPLGDDSGISPIRRITRGPFDRVILRPLRSVLVSATRPLAAASFAVAAALLLLGMLNLAGLAAGRAIDRQRELSLRVALGGSTWTLVRLLAKEHAIVVAAGTLAGLFVAPSLLSAAVSLLPPGLMLLLTPAINVRVVAFGVGSAVLAIAIVTTWSVRSALTAGVRPVLADAAGATPRARSRGRAFLIAGQVAVALVMALGGALLAASLVRVSHEDPGFETERRAKIRVNTPSTFSLDRMNALLDDIAHVPGVQAVGGLDEPFLERATTGSLFQKPSGALPTGDVEQLSVTAGFFRAAGIAAIEGRLPTTDEFDLGRRVIVVSRGVAAAFWPGRSAIGQTLVGNGGVSEVIGVVPDIRHAALDRDSEGEIYSSNAVQQRPDLLNLLIAFDRDPRRPLAQVQAELAARAPDVKIVRVETLTETLRATVQLRRFQAWLFGAFGAAALAIVGVGILGTVAMAVARRTREIGIRMALGARWSNVTRMVVREQSRSIAAGAACGGLVSLWLVRYLGDYLYKMTAYDWSAWTAAALALLAVTVGGAIVPALRASRIDPVKALRITT